MGSEREKVMRDMPEQSSVISPHPEGTGVDARKGLS